MPSPLRVIGDDIEERIHSDTAGGIEVGAESLARCFMSLEELGIET
jgi:hypothetical protein